MGKIIYIIILLFIIVTSIVYSNNLEEGFFLPIIFNLPIVDNSIFLTIKDQIKNMQNNW
jgi:hypothetical protein